METTSDALCLQTTALPLVLINARGEILTGSEEGRLRFTGFTPQFEALPDLAPAKSKLGALLQARQPLWLSDTTHLVRFAPLPASGPEQAAALLEWHPMPESEPLRILQEIGRAVNSSLILEDIFEALGEVLHWYIPYQEATIVILDDSQNGIKSLVRMQADGYLEISGENNTFAGYDPIVDRILAGSSPILYSQGSVPRSIVFETEALSAITAPLINKGVVIGLIAMSSHFDRLFSTHHTGLLAQVSEQLAVAVENAKLYWQTQAQAGREFLINQLTKAIRQSLEIEIILKTAVEELGKVTGVSRCAMRYFSPETEPGKASGQAFHYLLPGTPAMDETDEELEQRIFSLRKDQTLNPFILNDVRDCPASIAPPAYFEANGIKSLAVFPILVRDTLVGTITLHQCDTFRSWIAEDIDLLRAMAEHLGVALSQAQLFQKLEQQKQALEHALTELQQTQMHLIQSEKMAVLGQFVAGIAHEVNTPLGTISSNNDTLGKCLQKLQTETQPDNPSQLLGMMNDLVSLNRLASDRIHEIVKSLRNFARLDESELKTVDIHEGINSTLLVMRSSLKAHVKIIKHYGDDIPPVQCYPGLLNQVFMNLLVNAQHAMADLPAGSVTIETRALPEEGTVEVSFTDTGTGIPPENLVKIFDPGFTTKGVGVGTGLGLALCYKIIEKHHGRILVESTVGEGTRFRVQIPVKLSKA